MSINLGTGRKKIESVLLAAGQSSRMGSDKALLKIEGEFSVCRFIRKLKPFSAKIIIVLGDNFEKVSSIIKSHCFDEKLIEIVYNENHLSGMFSSVLKGFRITGGKFPVLLQMIDQPFVPANIYLTLLENYDESNLIFQPAKKTKTGIRKGHPLLFSKNFKQILAENRDKNMLSEIINAYESRRKLIFVDDESIFHNLNTPDELKKFTKE